MGVAWKVGERRACSACGKECIGAKSKHGSVGPIELEPDASGNVILFKDAAGELRYAVLPPGGVAVTDPVKKHNAATVKAWIAENFMVLRMNHFATCPRSEEFRRGRALPEEKTE